MTFDNWNAWLHERARQPNVVTKRIEYQLTGISGVTHDGDDFIHVDGTVEGAVATPMLRRVYFGHPCLR